MLPTINDIENNIRASIERDIFTASRNLNAWGAVKTVFEARFRNTKKITKHLEGWVKPLLSAEFFGDSPVIHLDMKWGNLYVWGGPTAYDQRVSVHLFSVFNPPETDLDTWLRTQNMWAHALPKLIEDCTIRLQNVKAESVRISNALCGIMVANDAVAALGPEGGRFVKNFIEEKHIFDIY